MELKEFEKIFIEECEKNNIDSNKKIVLSNGKYTTSSSHIAFESTDKKSKYSLSSFKIWFANNIFVKCNCSFNLFIISNPLFNEYKSNAVTK